jgi:hypothetical protein
MFRRFSTKRSTSTGVLFLDGHGVTTQAGRSAQRLEAARTAAAMKLSGM